MVIISVVVSRMRHGSDHKTCFGKRQCRSYGLQKSRRCHAILRSAANRALRPFRRSRRSARTVRAVAAWHGRCSDTKSRLRGRARRIGHHDLLEPGRKSGVAPSIATPNAAIAKFMVVSSMLTALTLRHNVSCDNIETHEERSNYDHGDLRGALVKAAVAEIERGGYENLSLRELADPRRVACRALSAFR